ncbi:DUF4238 domain-containing protein [Inquilinus sp. OTU3971]|uniref:DUF4238 domain-containing protein n=1 Tax=Inquilinus sp. OTU3971 TaxID=3043855 RepID=UPI00313B8E82
MSEQVSLKHHYLPEFYTKRWIASRNGKLCEFSCPYPVNKVIKPKRVHPAETGNERGLYEIKGVAHEQAQVVEDGFFKKLDTLASQALDRIEADDMLASNPPLRSAWSRFVLSLLLRAPNDLKWFRDDYLGRLLAEADQLDPKWLTLRGPEDPMTVREVLNESDPDIAQRRATLLLRELIDHSHICGGMNNMRWFVIDIPEEAPELLTSDRPVITPAKSFLSPKGQILMPIGPRRLFVATVDVALGKAIWATDRAELAEAVNQQVVGQAERYAYGSDDSSLAFVRDFMFAAPQPSLFQVLAHMRARRPSGA